MTHNPGESPAEPAPDEMFTPDGYELDPAKAKQRIERLLEAVRKDDTEIIAVLGLELVTIRLQLTKIAACMNDLVNAVERMEPDDR